MVSLVNIAAADVKIDFMPPYGQRKTFDWRQRGDLWYVSAKNIIQKMSTPTKSNTGTYKINDEDYNKTVSAFAKLQQ